MRGKRRGELFMGRCFLFAWSLVSATMRVGSCEQLAGVLICGIKVVKLEATSSPAFWGKFRTQERGPTKAST